MIFGIDAGGANVKLVGKNISDVFYSDLGEARDLMLSNATTKDDMIFEYNGRTGFAGDLARRESEFSNAMKGDTKAHEDAKIRVLLALHRNSTSGDVKIVVGQPISRHTDDEKLKIKQMLTGYHDITVNGTKKRIHIARVEVAAEGACVAFLVNDGGLKRIVDVGSGTVNLATVDDVNRFVDKDSMTIPLGMETIRNFKVDDFVRSISIKVQTKWKEQDNVYLCGGGAKKILEAWKQYYPNSIIVDKPTTANARAFYEVACKVYGG